MRSELGVPVTHTIIEKGMSPAEAVKLLADFERAARDKIVGEIVIENNLVNGSILLSRELSTLRLRGQAKLMINGRESVIEFDLPDWSGAPKHDYDKVRAIMGALAPKIAERIVAALESNIVSAVIPRGL
jgi:hypothetical protein